MKNRHINNNIYISNPIGKSGNVKCAYLKLYSIKNKLLFITITSINFTFFIFFDMISEKYQKGIDMDEILIIASIIFIGLLFARNISIHITNNFKEK